MPLVANIAVAGTAVFALTSKPATRALLIKNTGNSTLYYQTVPTGTATTLTTGNGTQLTSQENTVEVGVLDPPTGFDVYLISGGSTTATVQTIPI